jgi:hypothetical protein
MRFTKRSDSKVVSVCASCGLHSQGTPAGTTSHCRPLLLQLLKHHYGWLFKQQGPKSRAWTEQQRFAAATLTTGAAWVPVTVNATLLH